MIDILVWGRHKGKGAECALEGVNREPEHKW